MQLVSPLDTVNLVPSVGSVISIVEPCHPIERSISIANRDGLEVGRKEKVRSSVSSSGGNSIEIQTIARERRDEDFASYFEVCGFTSNSLRMAQMPDVFAVVYQLKSNEMKTFIPLIAAESLAKPSCVSL